MLLKLIDGGIVNIEEDTDSWNGCETCDYGSQYINEFIIDMTKFKIKIEVENMYDYALSSGDMMKIILPNIENITKMTEQDFALWLEEKVRSMFKGKYYSDVKVNFRMDKIK